MTCMNSRETVFYAYFCVFYGVHKYGHKYRKIRHKYKTTFVFHGLAPPLRSASKYETGFVFVAYLWCICGVFGLGREIHVFVLYFMCICKIFQNGEIHGHCHVRHPATSSVFLVYLCVFVDGRGHFRNTRQIRKQIRTNTHKYAKIEYSTK